MPAGLTRLRCAREKEQEGSGEADMSDHGEDAAQVKRQFRARSLKIPLTLARPDPSRIGDQRLAVVTGEETPPRETQAVASWLSRLTKT
ncbi:hypothetical protein GCM10007886_43640 [Methylobacterium gregans]|nr:hypothetical protein GCM10007886_43640 [Methylobacterium gregans]